MWRHNLIGRRRRYRTHWPALLLAALLWLKGPKLDASVMMAHAAVARKAIVTDATTATKSVSSSRTRPRKSRIITGTGTVLLAGTAGTFVGSRIIKNNRQNGDGLVDELQDNEIENEITDTLAEVPPVEIEYAKVRLDESYEKEKLKRAQKMVADILKSFHQVLGKSTSGERNSSSDSNNAPPVDVVDSTGQTYSNAPDDTLDHEMTTAAAAESPAPPLVSPLSAAMSSFSTGSWQELPEDERLPMMSEAHYVDDEPSSLDPEIELLEQDQEAPPLPRPAATSRVSSFRTSLDSLTPSFWRVTKSTTELPLQGSKYRAARQQPKDPATEQGLQQKYGAIDSVEERAYQILVDLGMVEQHHDAQQ